ncbi:MAG: SGNH/GDSL hydrolase family protein, partial [Alphaproteobacteria bacterium]
PLLVPGDAVLLMLGSNDYGLGVPMRAFRQRYAEMIDGLSTADVVLQGPGPTVPVCVTPIWRADAALPNYAGETLADYSLAIREICSSRRVPVIDGLELLGPDDEARLVDGVHPDAPGIQKIARRLAAKVLPLLEPVAPTLVEGQSQSRVGGRRSSDAEPRAQSAARRTRTPFR